jgi:hypothetical protein
MGRDILGNYCPGTDDCPLAHGNSWQDRTPCSQPGSIAYCDRMRFDLPNPVERIMEIMAAGE